MSYAAKRIVGSPQQKAIWTAMRKSDKHLLISARAGTGKTFTIVEGLKKVPKERSILFCAFNKSIAKELSSKVPHGVQCRTLHSLGFKIIRDNYEGVGSPQQDKTYDILDQVVGPNFGKRDRWAWKAGERPAIAQMVSLFKNTGLLLPSKWTPDKAVPAALEQSMDDLSEYHSVTWTRSKDMLWEIVCQIVYASLYLDDWNIIDFDDMIYWPYALGLSSDRHDLLCVDEYQDLNECQQNLVQKCGDRLVVVGDTRQSIYAFRGADAEAIPRATKTLKASSRGLDILPLTVCRRCPKTVIAMAQILVPDIEPMADAPRGGVNVIDYATAVKIAKPGDMFLCRCNAPLVDTIYRFFGDGRRAFMQGRDIGEGLIKLVERLSSSGKILDLETNLTAWQTQEQERLQARKAPASRVIALNDKCDCLRVIMEPCKDVPVLKTKLELLFADDNPEHSIRLSSVHRAKGLEANRVFLLAPELIPHPLADKPWERAQEMNIGYVAVTRAIETFYFVGSVSPCFGSRGKALIKDGREQFSASEAEIGGYLEQEWAEERNSLEDIEDLQF